MLRPPEAFRESMEAARRHRGCELARAIYGIECAEMVLARRESRALLATLRAARASEGERFGVGRA